MRKDVIKFLVLALLAIGAGPASAAFWQWSKTANSNATADPTINWAEGMSPSSVNDSARAMMARTSEMRDDISGLLVTAGSSTAYTVTTNQGLCQAPSSTTTPLDGQLISVTMSATNGAAPSLTADTCNSFPIQSSSGQAVASGTLINGSPYSMKFSNANSAWMLKGFYASATNVPLGGLMPYTLTTVPNSNFVFPAGQCLSTTTYSTYWTALGSPGPGSCGAGNFAVIDMSGTIPAGLDTMPGFSAANRLTSSSTGCGTAMTSVGARCANGNQSHTLTVAELAAHTHANSLTDPGHGHSNNAGRQGDTSTGGGGFTAGGFGAATINAAVTGMSINNASAGSGTAHAIVQPTVGVTYLLRVL